ncbi:hypothetical protein N9948_01660 [bacterium]|nr:hypothetical protein [bacterium]
MGKYKTITQAWDEKRRREIEIQLKCKSMPTVFLSPKMQRWEVDVLNNHYGYATTEEGIDTILSCLDTLDDIRWYKKLLKESDERVVYNKCLEHVDCRTCFLLILEFRWDSPTPYNKASAVIKNIKIRKYLDSALKALSKIEEKKLGNDLAILTLTNEIKIRLDTMNNSLDFILD